MTVWEAMQLALEAIIGNRLRSILTMLGIICGVGAVIGAVSLTEGAKVATLKQFEAMGTNTLQVFAGQARVGPIGGGMGSATSLTVRDAEAIAEECPSVIAVAPQVSTSGQVKAGNTNTSTSIIGTTPAYEQVGLIKMKEGAFFTTEDEKRRRKVAVLGATVVENLFGKGESVAGTSIRIGGVTFRVIGQYAPKGSSGPFDPDDQIIIPLSTAIYRLAGGNAPPGSPRDTVSRISVSVVDMEHATRAKAEIATLLRERHKLHAGEDDDFRIMAAADLVEGAEASNRILTLLFASIAVVSLLVGGIGIMNIMLVSVTERTREIGLRKAVGATPRDILLQFLIESVTLSLAGGLVGVLTGVAITYVVRTFGLNSAVSVPWVGIAFTFAAMVGVVFGLLPAQKAAQLDPVEALRYE
jgi:putative ABC transport system permease protein